MCEVEWCIGIIKSALNRDDKLFESTPPTVSRFTCLLLYMPATMRRFHKRVRRPSNLSRSIYLNIDPNLFNSRRHLC